MTALRVVTVAAMAALVGLGLARAPRLLEPGRSDRAGVTLSPPSGATGGRESDWTHDAARAVVHKHDDLVAIRARAKGLQLMSRQLPVRADRCYSAQLRIAASQGVSFVLLDGSGTGILAPACPDVRARRHDVVQLPCAGAQSVAGALRLAPGSVTEARRRHDSSSTVRYPLKNPTLMAPRRRRLR